MESDTDEHMECVFCNSSGVILLLLYSKDGAELKTKHFGISVIPNHASSHAL